MEEDKFKPTSLDGLFKDFTRLEIIDKERVFVKYLQPNESFKVSVQDSGITMKLFVTGQIK